MDGPVRGEDGLARCPWAATPGMLRDYHDTEWGLPVSGEDALFERLSLEGFQAGLSWRTILAKRPRFREVFHRFDVDRVADMSDEELHVALGDPGIVRNRAKVFVTRQNARAAQALRSQGGLEALVHAHRPEVGPAPVTAADVPTVSPESSALSRALKKRGFGFVGPTTVHALMEAVGIVDTHLVGCHRRGCAHAVG
jgi:DNA-3-methyladenine glycosylase I